MGLYDQVDYDFSGPLQPQDLFGREYVTMGGVIDHHLTTTVQRNCKTPEKPVVTTNNGLFLVLAVKVQDQQNSRFNVRLHKTAVVLRLNTYFQLRYFIFCTTKIAVLSFVFLGVPFDFFISIEGRFLRCGTTTLERCSTQLNLF